MHSEDLRKTRWLSAVLLWKLLKSRGRSCFLVLQECILATGSCSSKIRNSAVFYGRSCNNFVVRRAEVFERLVCWASLLGDFLTDVSSLARIAYNFSSATQLAPCLAFCLAAFSLLFKFCILCFLGGGCQGNWHRSFFDIFQQTHICNTAALKTDAFTKVYLSQGMMSQQWKTEMHLPTTNPAIHSASLLSTTAEFTLPFENSARELAWPRIRHDPWHVHYPDLTIYDICLWEV